MTNSHENITLMEPLVLPESTPHRSKLIDLVMELTAKSVQFKSSLPPALQRSLADSVRAMNCYYSNLIEGHNTHPIAIEQALQANYDADPKKRNLQLEAKAHIEVQEWIDNGGIKDSIFAPAVICEIHKRFCEKLPDELLWVEEPNSGKKMKVVPGKLRNEPVKVGQHIAINSNSISRFLERYHHVYSQLGKTETILALAAAHHRFLWIHPFLDGNGRVARFISYTTILNILDNGGLWSVARGLARNVEEYKKHLMNCDANRRNDLDGRGNLSQEALYAFTEFFLETCIDQVHFMQSLMQPDLLRTRVLLWAKEEIELKHIPQQSMQILERILYRGEIARGEIPEILNLTERQARRITASLVESGVLTSDTPKSAVRLAFPAKLAQRWMPGLFPEF